MMMTGQEGWQASPRVARCGTRETAWNLVNFLEQTTRTWDPPVVFMLVLPRGAKVEVWPTTALRPADRRSLQELVKKFISQVTIR